MVSKMKEIKPSISNKLGHFSQKNDHKNQRIINILNGNNLNQDIIATSDPKNQAMHVELEHFKNNGLLYSSVLKFR